MFDNQDGSVHDNTYDIDGRLIGYSFGIAIFGADDTINIGVTGECSGYDGIVFEGNDTTVINRGHVSGLTGWGIVGEGENLRVHNSGTITGVYGVETDYTSGSQVVVNNTKGSIFGFVEGIRFESSAGTLVNHGLVHVPTGEDAFEGA